MAYLELRSSGYRIVLRYDGKKLSTTLGTTDADEAESSLFRLKATLHDLKSGRRTLPEGADLLLWLLSGGQTETLPGVVEKLTLKDLLQSYSANYQADAKEENTRYTERIHFEHLKRLIGAKAVLSDITVKVLQKYVHDRIEEEVSVATVKKELGTLASVWNKFGIQQEYVSLPCPTKGLIYPKTEEKPPFMTWAEIERRVGKGGDQSLWDCLFLTKEQTDELVQHVADVRPDTSLPTMVALAAYTGMRRSELIRARTEDVDLTSGLITIREKKKRKGELSYRRAPLSPKLKGILAAWIDKHPDDKQLFAGKPDEPMTVQAVAHQIRKALDGSKWSVVRGWHVLRHSFITNCATAGIDQRLIDLWVGHTTEAMRKRYTHLIPSTSNEAIARLYG